MLRVEGAETEASDENIRIRLVVTNVRLIWTNDEIAEGDLPGHARHGENDYRYPEYEAEGWLYAPPGDAGADVWVRCALRSNDTDEIQECTVYLLEPFEGLGTDQTVYMK